MRIRFAITAASILAMQAISSLWGAPATFATRKVIELNNAVVGFGDFNGDGRTDIFSAAQGGAFNDYQVTIQINNGDGTFSAGPVVDLGPNVQPLLIATGDFNGDGRLDFAVLSTYPQFLYVVLQHGSGFEIGQIQILGNLSGILNMAVADINGDRRPDIIIPSSAGAIILLNAGGGSFKPAIVASAPPMSFVAVADFNGDKRADLALATTNCCASGNSIVLLGDGHGAFYAPVSQPAFTSIAARIAVADFNQDGKPDIAAVSSNTYPASLEIAFGKGDGTFAPPSSWPIPSQTPTSVGVVAGDLNGDGIPDAAVLATGNATAVLAFMSTGAGGFGTPAIYPVQAGAGFLALVNLNNDRFPDVVVNALGSASVVSELFNTGNGGFQDGVLVTTTAATQYMVSGNFNSDSKPDLVAVDSFAGLTVFLNTGNDASLFKQLPSLPYYTGPVVPGDFDNDGRLDLVVINYLSAQTLLGNGNGTFFYLPSQFNIGGQTPSATAADMNNDGKLDLITMPPDILLGNGDGTFQPPYAGSFNYCYSGNNVVAADFNRDGKLDVLTDCGGYLALYPGNGDGTLGYPLYPPISYGYQSFAVGDFNRDGIRDIVFTSNPTYYMPASGLATVMFGQGDGTFVTGPSIQTPTGIGGQFGKIVVSDFNGDGIVDLAIMDYTDSVFSILQGNGDGGFQAPQLFGTATNPTCIIAGRFRANAQRGKPDLAFCTGPGIALDLNSTQ